MKTDKISPKNIDEYISSFPAEVQDILQKIRMTIQKAAPKATETINYQMPTFKMNGNLVHFAAYKKHIGFYPAPSGIKKFEKEIAGYKSAKGSVQFPLDEPIPYDLITEIVQFRAEEQLNKKK
ncbi:MAG: hypothetical protein DHS20C18_04410 [Saprospiraceae bacterium]|nr:MAG: hypothetical protein DHS20C18_04410 [Saprospiraceae bacterium]